MSIVVHCRSANKAMCESPEFSSRLPQEPQSLHTSPSWQPNDIIPKTPTGRLVCPRCAFPLGRYTPTPYGVNVIRFPWTCKSLPRKGNAPELGKVCLRHDYDLRRNLGTVLQFVPENRCRYGIIAQKAPFSWQKSGFADASARCGRRKSLVCCLPRGRLQK